MSLKLLTHSEQLAAYLRDELLRGRWKDTFPGTRKLGGELGVNPNTMKAAMDMLEKEGLLVARGAGKSRMICLPEDIKRNRSMRIAVFSYGENDKEWPVFLKLFNRLHEKGYEVQFAPRSLKELKMDPRRIAPVVERTDADAWIIQAGSREVLEWFSGLSTPVLAYAGRQGEVPVAGVRVVADKALRGTVRMLHNRGHERIVMITEKVHRVPRPSPLMQSMFDEMHQLGLRTGSYNLPDWSDTPEGLFECLDQLFALTPPDSLIIDPPHLFFPILKHLQKIGIDAPKDVSLISVGFDAGFNWLRPRVSRIEWDFDKLMNYIVRWARSVERGKPLNRKYVVEASVVMGETVGSARSKC